MRVLQTVFVENYPPLIANEAIGSIVVRVGVYAVDNVYDLLQLLDA